ncbi:MAG: hypothetical protein ACRD5G_14205 [Candidatus Acidiferrales bacterium]
MIRTVECASPGKTIPWAARPSVVALAWVVCTILANYLLGEFDFGWAMRLALALLPLAGFLYLVWAHVVWYTRSDELQQRIQLTIWAHALVTSVMGAIGLYYFQKAGFFPATAYPTLDYFGDVLPFAIIIGYLLGYWRAAKRYA